MTIQQLQYLITAAKYGSITQAAEALFAAAPALMALGAYFDRPYGRLPELVYTEPGGVDAIRRLEAVFDPAGILNPGKLCFPKGGEDRV